MRTASTAFLEALQEAGVDYIFANFGSDHPGLIEAIAEARERGRKLPHVVTCPNEMVAMSCAHGHAQVSGRTQAVVVHVECGTQSLAGAVHNAAKGRIPILVFAGLSPYTQEGELKGSRNEFIQWIQDVPDQRGIVRQYMKFEYEIRAPHNVKQIVHRALQVAASDPRGPVYLVGAREAMEAAAPEVAIDAGQWRPVSPGALAQADVENLAERLSRAERPLIVTSYIGRKASAVEQLRRLCGRLGVGVLESVPNYVNYPHSDPLYQGAHWNHPFQNGALAEADFVLVVDSDVPWIPTVSRPRDDTDVVVLDTDPLKLSIPLWYLKARKHLCADATIALTQVNARLDEIRADEDAVARRRAHWTQRHGLRRGELARREAASGPGVSAEFLTACVRRAIRDDAIVLSEGITNYPVISDHMMRDRPGGLFTSGGGSLGWNGGAAIGMKLAAADRTVVALTGDGSYMFSQPSTVHWMARRYETPFLQVIYNNGGWNAPRFSALAVHPDGYAARADDLDLSFHPVPDYGGIAAAAGGAWTRKIVRPEDVESGIQQALAAVHDEGRAAVLDVELMDS